MPPTAFFPYNQGQRIARRKEKRGEKRKKRRKRGGKREERGKKDLHIHCDSEIRDKGKTLYEYYVIVGTLTL